MKNKRGITLIALVITIIVLLVLAGVSLSLVLGNNGVLKQAQNGVEKHSEAEIAEQIKLSYSFLNTFFCMVSKSIGLDIYSIY